MPKGITPQLLQCKARRRDGSGERCGKWAIRGREVCRLHGGKSPAPGPSHPSWKNGRYTKLPTGLLERYWYGMRDPALLSTQAEIATLDARVNDLLGKIDKGDGIEDWATAQDLMRACLSAQAEGDPELLEESIAELAKVLFSHDTEDVWSEVRRFWDLRRKLVDSERKLRETAQQNVPVGQVLSFMSNVALTLKAHLEPDQLRTVTLDLQRIMVKDGFNPTLGGQTA